MTSASPATSFTLATGYEESTTLRELIGASEQGLGYRRAAPRSSRRSRPPSAPPTSVGRCSGASSRPASSSWTPTTSPSRGWPTSGVVDDADDGGGVEVGDHIVAPSLDCAAPEQIRGERLDRRVDVYALGCELYQATTGVPSFPASGVAKLEAHLYHRPPRPPSWAFRCRPSSIASWLARSPRIPATDTPADEQSGRFAIAGTEGRARGEGTAQRGEGGRRQAPAA